MPEVLSTAWSRARSQPLKFEDLGFRPVEMLEKKNKYMLFVSREVRIGKNCARALEYGPRPQTEGTVFPNTDRPRPANNVFNLFCGKLLYKKYLR